LDLFYHHLPLITLLLQVAQVAAEVQVRFVKAAAAVLAVTEAQQKSC
jgi:hypothetical protein